MAKLRGFLFWLMVLIAIAVAIGILAASLMYWITFVTGMKTLDQTVSSETRIAIAKLAMSTAGGAAAIITALGAWVALRSAWDQRSWSQHYRERLRVALDCLKSNDSLVRAQAVAELTSLAERNDQCARVAFDSICWYIRSATGESDDSVKKAVATVIQHFKMNPGRWLKTRRGAWSHWPLNLGGARLPLDAWDWRDCWFSEVDFRDVVFPTDKDVYFSRVKFDHPRRARFDGGIITGKIHIRPYSAGEYNPFSVLKPRHGLFPDNADPYPVEDPELARALPNGSAVSSHPYSSGNISRCPN